jgi:site-specific recombinase XerD
MKEKQPILPIFDSIEYLENQNDFSYLSDNYNISDIKQAQRFLKYYKGSLGTFNAYRREIERLLHWNSLIKSKTLKDLKRDDIENYIEFCQKPPKQWIGTHKPSRFIVKESVRVPNLEWKPFIATLSKADHRQGKKPTLKDFELSQAALKQLFAIIGSFYNYLLQEEYAFMNPVAMIRQKSKFIRKIQNKPKIRRLSELQWHYVIQTAKELAEKDAEYHERTLFIMFTL